jgi:hypothetical protein
VRLKRALAALAHFARCLGRRGSDIGVIPKRRVSVRAIIEKEKPASGSAHDDRDAEGLAKMANLSRLV